MLSPGLHTRDVVRTLFHYPEARLRLRPTSWLDGLRGVAAFEVLLYHWHLQFLFYGTNLAYGSEPDATQWWRLPFIRTLYYSGHAMVNVFFLISGFVLTQRSLTFIRTKQLDKLYPSVSSALFRRGIRIYAPTIPVTFIAMLFVYTGLRNMPMASVQDSLLLQIIDWVYACRDFIQPFHLYEVPYDILHRYEAIMWTLPLEIYGSLVCYLTVLAVSRITHHWKRTAVVVIFIVFAGIKGNWWSMNFLLGMLYADFLIWQGQIEGRSWTTGSYAKSFWILAFIWAFYVAGMPDARYELYNLPGFDWYYHHVPENWIVIEGGGRFWWLISGCTMTVAISQLPPLKAVFETRFCQYLGRISFMLYLVHMLVFELIGKLWKNSLETMTGGKGNSTYVVYFGFWIVMLPQAMIAAGQVTKYVDEPCIRLAKWLEAWFTEDRDKYESIPI